MKASKIALSYLTRSISYILVIGVFGSATSSVWPRVGYRFVSLMSESLREPRPVQLTKRVVDGWSLRTAETEG